MSTTHIDAGPGDFAETVLLPGDPLRARHIAENLLDRSQQVAGLRNMLGFTGEYRGQRVSVMGSGMGIPSACIYATELLEKFGVRRLVRVGTCGAVRDDIRLGDLILAQGACTDSGVNRQRFGGMDFAAIASWALLSRVAEQAGRQALPVRVGNVFSSDLFYAVDPKLAQRLVQMGILGIDMEAAGLYGVAAACGAEALTVLTVSDHLPRGEALPPAQRATGVDAMIRLVLDALTSASG
ncbi:MAG: purine-nucleoside phosphorylase [Xanthomonadales bacterium]|nr:purine-nucleoside phosphorylase [Xanthomonadales bacterium]